MAKWRRATTELQEREGGGGTATQALTSHEPQGQERALKALKTQKGGKEKRECAAEEVGGSWREEVGGRENAVEGRRRGEES